MFMLILSSDIQKILMLLRICSVTAMSKCNSWDILVMSWVETREGLALEAVATDRISQNYR